MIEIISDKVKIEEYFDILKKRANVNSSEFSNIVKDIIKNVELKKDLAVEEYTKKFDDPNFSIKDIEISKDIQKKAFDSLDSNMKRVLLNAKERILSYHEHQKRTTFEYKDNIGASLGQRITPLKRVGVYVPGGKAFYPSSALMNILPAKVAGCKEVIMVTPAVKGYLNPLVLAAAYVCDVDRLFKIGGAQAIAALALGTESIPRVDKIVGPGNIFVALAKREVYGLCGIDSIAGPSEIAIIADKTAKPRFLAADLLAQAEHDPMASSTLLITDKNVANEVVKYVKEFYNLSNRQEILDSSLTKTSRIILVDNLDKAIELSNRIAPEHLELALDDARSILNKIENAGAIFIGHYSAEVFGDYMAGPNHVLPTCGTARFFSPLGVDDFIKKTSLIEFDYDSASKILDDVDVFAKCENLGMHALSASLRKEK